MSGVGVFIAMTGTSGAPLLRDNEDDRDFWWLYWWANAAVIVALVCFAYHARAANPVESRECIRGHYVESGGKSKGRRLVCDHWRVTLKESR